MRRYHSFNFTVKTTDSTTGAGPYSGSQSFTLVIAAPTVALSPATLPNGTAGTAYTQTVSATGGTAAYSYSVSSGVLPAGVTLNSLTGSLSGTPTAGGAVNFSITATDSTTGNGPYTASRAYAVTIAAATITITPGTVPTATIASAYSQAFAASGGTSPYNFTTISTLPAGITLSSAGVLSGTPTSAGSFSITVKAADSATGSGPYSSTTTVVLIVNAPSVSVSPATFVAATVGIATTQTISASGGTSPYTFALSSGTLPTGLNLNTTTGVLSGTPTSGGSYSFTLKVTDSSTGTGAPFSASFPMSFTVAPPTVVVAPASFSAPNLAVPFSQTFTASGGTSPFNYSIATGALPAGLTLSATGVLSGIPTAGGTFNFTVKATDSSTGAGPYSGTQSYSVTIAAPTLTIVQVTLPVAADAIAYAQQLSTTGGTAPYTYSITSGALPTGITLSSTGLISGTSTVTPAAFNVTIKSVDSSSGTGPFNTTRAYTLTLNSAVPVAGAVST
jgi:hypothetical protein